MKILRLAGLLMVSLAISGADGDAVGVMRFEPLLSPALIVTIGFFVWKEVHAMRQNEKEAGKIVAAKVTKATADIEAIKQLLNGYSHNNGILQSLDNIKRAFTDAQLWMTRVGDHLDIPYERRTDVR